VSDPRWHWKAAPHDYKPGRLLNDGERDIGHVGKGVDDPRQYRAMMFKPTAWSGEFPTFEAAEAGLLLVAEAAHLEEAVWLLDRRAWADMRMALLAALKPQLRALGCSNLQGE
jgi:hypothetical protein